MSGVVFAYAAVELVGTAAGETAHPHKIMPRAINSVIARIAVFYVGSLFLLALLLPYTTYKAGESPFVTFFSKIGVEGAGTIMNIVVLTAAFSSLNAGLYSTGRILRSMAMNGSAPKFTSVMSSRGVPYGGIFLTAVVGLFGVILNLLFPGEAFEIVLNIAALGIIASWGTIVICQIQLYRWSKRGILERPSFRLWGTPYTGYLTLAFLFGVVVLMALDPPIGTWTVASAGAHHSGAHRRLVCRPRPGAGDRSRTRGLHRFVPRRREPAAAATRKTRTGDALRSQRWSPPSGRMPGGTLVRLCRMAADIVPIRLGLTKGDLYTLWAPRWRDSGDEWEALLGKDDDLYGFESVADLTAFVRTNTDNDLTDHPAWEGLTECERAPVRPAGGTPVRPDRRAGAVGREAHRGVGGDAAPHVGHRVVGRIGLRTAHRHQVLQRQPRARLARQRRGQLQRPQRPQALE